MSCKIQSDEWAVQAAVAPRRLQLLCEAQDLYAALPEAKHTVKRLEQSASGLLKVAIASP